MSLVAKRICAFASLAATFAGCQSRPEDVPGALEAALQRHDKPAVLALVDRASQPLVESMLNAMPKPAESPYWLPGKAAASHVVRAEAGEAGLLLTVESEGVSREWALVQEGGAWKVDLAATAAHRAWDVGYRDAK